MIFNREYTLMYANGDKFLALAAISVYSRLESKKSCFFIDKVTLILYTKIWKNSLHKKSLLRQMAFLTDIDPH